MGRPLNYYCDPAIGVSLVGRLREWVSRALAALCVLLLAAVPAQGRTALTDLRLGEWSDRARLVLETEGELSVELRATRQALFLTIEGLTTETVRQALHAVVPEDHPYISRAFSEARSGATQITLELRQPVEARSFRLAPMEGFRHRWVLDLFPRAVGPRVSAARLGQHSERTRIVLESEESLNATLVMLSNPRQLILELGTTELSTVLTELADGWKRDHPFLDDLQFRRDDNGALQLVLNLSRPVRADMFNLQPFGDYGHRLVLDMYPRDAGADPSENVMLAEEEPGDSEAEEAPQRAVESPEPTREAVEHVKDEAAREAWYEVIVNGQATGDVTLALFRDAGKLFVDGRDLRRWRLLDPPARALEHFGGDYYPLGAFPGLNYHVDDRAQQISLDVPARHFETTSLLGHERELLEPDPTPVGGFLNYDILAFENNGDSTASALLELGAFNGWGAASSRFVARSSSSEGGEKMLRLDSSWTRDDPASLRSLLLGDSVTSGSAWGGAVRFGGLQWGRNFDTQPGFVTLPMPGMTGEAVLPSTVDLYINDALRLRREVPSGPFSIESLPVITGRGEARLVVRDILGNERIITEDYYASSELLRKGLHDYSYEAGLIRENYGQTSDDYGRAVAVGTHRYGFSDSFTAELRGEFLADQRSVGVAGAWSLPLGGVMSGALASSHGERGAGNLLSLGFQRQGEWLNWSMESQVASERFVRLGTDGRPLPRRQTRASVSFASGAAGSFGLAYIQRKHYHQEDVELFSANYRLRLGRFGQLNVSALHAADSGDTSLNLHLSFPLGGERTSGSYSRSSSARGEPQESIQVRRGLPAGSGLGYHVRAGRGVSDYQQLGLSARTNQGTYRVDAAQSEGKRTYQARASGSLAAAGSTLLHGRRLGSSFGVIRLSGFPGVRVYAENQLVGRTNNQGHALIPHLRPYEKNRLAIEQADLPLSAQVTMLEMQVVPSWGSGIVVDFPVSRSRDALLRLFLDNGEALPVGARVEIEGRAQRFPVGRRGEVYLTGLDSYNSARAFWGERECHFEFSLEETDEMLLDLGDHHCKEEFR